MASKASSSDFPYALTISLPLPTRRLASAAMLSLQVDSELSHFVQRSMNLAPVPLSDENAPAPEGEGEDKRKEPSNVDPDLNTEADVPTLLVTEYRATTNRMLRVSVNGFMENLGVVLGAMEELDVDVLANELGGA